MRRRFRVENLTVNLAERVQLDELLCFRGTHHCFGRTIFCLLPSQGCCGPFFSNPGGGGTLSGGCFTQSITITDCDNFSQCGHVISGPGGCTLQFSTCPGPSTFDFEELVDVFEDLQGELNELMVEVDERGPKLREAAGPTTAAEFDATEAELKAAMERIQEMRKSKGV